MAKRIPQSSSNDNESETIQPEIPLAIPRGVVADVQVKYKSVVDPNQDNNRRAELQQLADLAGEDLNEPPADEISAFCYNWQNYAGYPLQIIRLPDPPEKRLAGNGYVHPCFNLERLGGTTFDPSNLIATLQFVNNGSGGVFRVWLTDYDGTTAIPGANLQRVSIADPPRNNNAPQAAPLLQVPSPSPPPPPSPPVKSDSERKLEEVKDALFTKALDRALNPPQQLPAQPGSQSQLPADQQAMLYILGNTDILPNVFGKLSELAQQTAGVAREPTIKERAIDAGMELLKTNPAIINQVTSVAERLIARVFGHDPRFDGQPQVTPQQQPVYQQTPAYIPQTTVDNETVNNQPSSIDQGDEDMAILDDLIGYLNSDEPLTLTHPAILQLRAGFPVKFKLAMTAIRLQPLNDIIEWIKDTGGAPYISMLDGHSGPFIRERLASFQQLIIETYNHAVTAQQAAKQQQQQTTSPTPPTPPAPPANADGSAKDA